MKVDCSEPCCHHHAPHLANLLELPASDHALRVSPQRELAPLPQPAALLAPGTLLGRVLSEENARADGRFLVEFATGAGTTERVLAERASGLCVSPGDRVLVVVPQNVATAVITTVLARTSDLREPVGMQARCDSASAQNGSHLVLRETDSLRVTSPAGQMLMAIQCGASGPVLRLGEGTLELDVPGVLNLTADNLRLTTRRGPLQLISEAGDVVVQGQTIRLN